MGNLTNELRARLDEMGVEYDTYDLSNGEHVVSWIDVNNIDWEVVQRGENFEIHALQLVTPEQAIAAMAGTVPETKYLMALDEAREAQRKLEMCQTSQRVYQSKCRSLKETNADLRRIINDMKAATTGAGTCKDLGGIGANGEQVFHCSECGCVLSLYDGEGVNNLCTSFIYDYPRFCPECGRKVIESKDN